MIIGRMIYSIGYTMKGASGRLIGVAIIDIALIALLVISIISCVKLIRGEALTIV